MFRVKKSYIRKITKISRRSFCDDLKIKLNLLQNVVLCVLSFILSIYSMFYAKFALITKQMKGPRVESSLHKSKPGVITTEISCSVYDQILPIEVVKMYKDIAVGPGNAVQADTG